jgi:hypothetical protein
MKLSMVTLPLEFQKKMMGNLGAIEDWYIKENFSYIRVFGFYISPHALPLLLPDRLVWR